jgi:hypothetical protein
MKKETAAKALIEKEKALENTAESEKFYMLADLAKVALEADEIDKAKSYASELLSSANRYPNDWNYGNAIHHGNLILGRIALRLGDLTSAKKYLLSAGNTPGSPQLNSFGPNMSLAKELLEKGEMEVVIKYFQLCANFWEMGKDRLEAWTAAVRTSEMPDFGANLDY